MPITYQLADGPVNKLVETIIARREPDLKEAGVTVQVLFAYGDGDAPPIKVGGYACAAKIKINSRAQRVAGLPDATITVDGDQWKDWTERRQEAVLAHQLHHLLVVRFDDGMIKEDDAGRPKLKMRLHDHQIGVFECIMNDYREDSLDHEAVLPLLEYTQKTFSFWG